MTPGLVDDAARACLGLRELGHGLGALGHGVLRELAGQHEADRRLNVAARHGRTLVNAAQLRRLGSDFLERVRHEVVDDRDALFGDARLGVHLLHDLEDVAVEGGLALAALDDRGLGNLLDRHCS